MCRSAAACAPRRRPEKLREMTYTQFWNLVRERKVDTVSRACWSRGQARGWRRCSLSPAAGLHLAAWSLRCSPA